MFNPLIKVFSALLSTGLSYRLCGQDGVMPRRTLNFQNFSTKMASLLLVSFLFIIFEFLKWYD